MMWLLSIQAFLQQIEVRKERCVYEQVSSYFHGLPGLRLGVSRGDCDPGNGTGEGETSGGAGQGKSTRQRTNSYESAF
jgi:hypothetical protein